MEVICSSETFGSLRTTDAWSPLWDPQIQCYILYITLALKRIVSNLTWKAGVVATSFCIVLWYSLAIIRSVHKPLANIRVHLHVGVTWPPGRWIKWREHATAEGTARWDFLTVQIGLESFIAALSYLSGSLSWHSYGFLQSLKAKLGRISWLGHGRFLQYPVKFVTRCKYWQHR
jgi:hypothetical protein